MNPFPVTTIAEVRDLCREIRTSGKTLGLVPTMGALHAGHLALVRAALERCDAVAVSIFVNPTQFAPEEDFARYPRSLDDDCEMLEKAGTDFVFAPSIAEMYPAGASTFVELPVMGDRLDGASRPGHFRGVATVVTKLLNIFQPDRIFFGQKDAVQAAILRKMVKDLDVNVRFEVCPIIRDADGLALSSRNRYLSSEERRRALVLPRALDGVRQRVEQGEYRSAPLIAEAQRILAREPGVRLDYLAIVDPNTLVDLPDVRQGALIAVATFVGATRLIDNLLLLAV